MGRGSRLAAARLGLASQRHAVRTPAAGGAAADGNDDNEADASESSGLELVLALDDGTPTKSKRARTDDESSVADEPCEQRSASSGSQSELSSGSGSSAELESESESASRSSANNAPQSQSPPMIIRLDERLSRPINKKRAARDSGAGEIEGDGADDDVDDAAAANNGDRDSASSSSSGESAGAVPRARKLRKVDAVPGAADDDTLASTPALATDSTAGPFTRKATAASASTPLSAQRSSARGAVSAAAAAAATATAIVSDRSVEQLRLSDVEVQFDALAQRIERMCDNQSGEAKRAHAALREALTATKRDLVKRLNVAERAVQRLETASEGQTARLAAVAKASGSLERRVERQQTQLAAQKAENDERDGVLAELQRQIAAATSAGDGGGGKAPEAVSSAALAAVDQQSSDLRAQIAKLEAAAAKRDEQLETMARRLQQMSADQTGCVRDLVETNAELVSRIDTIEELGKRLQNNMSAASTMLASTDRKIAENKRRLDKLASAGASPQTPAEKLAKSAQQQQAQQPPHAQTAVANKAASSPDGVSLQVCQYVTRRIDSLRHDLQSQIGVQNKTFLTGSASKSRRSLPY